MNIVLECATFLHCIGLETDITILWQIEGTELALKQQHFSACVAWHWLTTVTDDCGNWKAVSAHVYTGVNQKVGQLLQTGLKVDYVLKSIHPSWQEVTLTDIEREDRSSVRHIQTDHICWTVGGSQRKPTCNLFTEVWVQYTTAPFCTFN